MTLAHLHLLLNHFPTIGTVIALGLLLLGFVRRNADLKRVSLEVFFAIALVTLPAYLSGVAAQQEIREREGVSLALIEAHEDAALQAFVLMQFTGALAWLALWQVRRISRPRSWTIGGVLLLSVLTMALMTRAANLGGEIRHPEIVYGLDEAAIEEAVAPEPGWLSSASVAAFVTDRSWVWPAGEALHFVGLWLLFGVLLLVNLRMLGVMKIASFAAVHRLLPWAVLGFAINMVTGMLFVNAAPEQYTQNISFYWKIGLMLLAGVNLLYLTVFEGPWEVGPGQSAPLRVKAMAASAILLWVGVMYFGRMLPFIGNAF